MQTKKIIASVALLLTCLAAFAVLNEKDLPRTLKVLRYELADASRKMEISRSRMTSRNDTQHESIVAMVKKCNELSLMLYSQNQDYTFDLTYALKEVTRNYESFSKGRRPYDEIVSTLDIEIDRYQRLVEALRRMPPALSEPSCAHIPHAPDSVAIAVDSVKASHAVHDFPARRKMFSLDSLGLADRDSCIVYAANLLQMYTDARNDIIRDKEYYDVTSSRLKEGYDYAQSRYKELQQRIFIKGQDNYLTVLKTLPAYCKRAVSEAVEKYSNVLDPDSNVSESDWRGVIVYGFIFFVIAILGVAVLLSRLLMALLSRRVKFFQTDWFKSRKSVFSMLLGAVVFAVATMVSNCFTSQNFVIEATWLLLIFCWLFVVILLSQLVHMDASTIKAGLKMYSPLILMGLIVITFRIIFIPNRLINLIFPPLLLGFTFWQFAVCNKVRNVIPGLDLFFGWITFVVFAAVSVCAFIGYVYLSVQLLVWWLFQVTAIQTITALYDLVKAYGERKLPVAIDKKNRGDNIHQTWFYDFISMAMVPVAAILTVPASLYLASEVFDLTAVCEDIFAYPFFDVKNASGELVLNVSINKLVIVSTLFFVFRYLSYAIKASYKKLVVARKLRETGKQRIYANEVNLSLGNNIISVLIWLTYIIFIVNLCKIPMGAVSIVAAGLATGVGLAMKDVLNNFIYGIQLMSGRVRVGDFIECNGITGKVESISYQSTSIVTLEGVSMSITNSNLFNNSFKNLTKTSPYVFVKIIVGVAYGTDVAPVCAMIDEAVVKINGKDKYGHFILDPKYGVKTVFEDFGESSVNLAVKMYATIEERAACIAKAKTIIYDTLNSAGISIPFPQRDIRVRINN